MTKYCANCGAKLEKGAKFCPSCGLKIEEAPAAPIQPAPVVPDTNMPPPQQQVQSIPQQPIQTPKKSKTKLIAIIAIIVVAVVVAVLVFMFLPGESGKDDMDKFYGKWGVEYFKDSSSNKVTWEFFQNGTLDIVFEDTNHMWYTYDLADSRLCIISDEYNYYHCYDYELKSNGNELNLKAAGITIVLMSKIG